MKSFSLSITDVTLDNLIELGQIISGDAVGRINDRQITIADLTGLAIQDLQIAKAIHDAVSQ